VPDFSNDGGASLSDGPLSFVGDAKAGCVIVGAT
jgi:hypothetical protein